MGVPPAAATVSNFNELRTWPNRPPPPSTSQLSAISMVFPQILVDIQSTSIEISVIFNRLQSILISFNHFDLVKNEGIH